MSQVGSVSRRPGSGYGSAMQDNRAPRDNSVQAVDRAISILQVLARQGAAGVTEIAGELGMHKSTAFRLLATLDARGLVEQNAERGSYQLGHGVVQLAAGATRSRDLSLLGLPLYRELAETVGETVNVAVPDGRWVVSVDQVIGSAAVTTVNWVGQRSPLHATSAGKVFLASMPPDQVDAVLAEGLERYTPHTVVDPVVLRRQLGVIRERGYASTSEEHELGLAAVAAPISSLDGSVVAAVTVSGPTFRVNEDTIPGLAAHVLAAADAVSQRNGRPKRG
jgi:IclR family transcriptional regulator, acetate operon repressor